MALNYWVLFIVLILFSIVLIFKKRKNESKNKIKKIANTSGLKKSKEYQKVYKKYKRLINIFVIMLFLIIITSSIISTRLIKINKEDSMMYNRDIIICLDVSDSMAEADQAIAKEFLKIVKDLKNERIGISIFNTSSVLVVPLTDDYEYLNKVLKDLDKAFDTTRDFDWESLDESVRLSNLIQSGTLEGVDEIGSSIIGDGLATCALSFGNIKNEKRSRSIILATDNEPNGEPIVTMKQAAQICLDNNIRVYGINPFESLGEKENINEYKETIKYTNGSYYNLDNATAKEIVSDIEKQEKSYIKGNPQITKSDIPLIPFTMLLISFSVLIIICKKVKV